MNRTCRGGGGLDQSDGIGEIKFAEVKLGSVLQRSEMSSTRFRREDRWDRERGSRVEFEDEAGR